MTLFQLHTLILVVAFVGGFAPQVSAGGVSLLWLEAEHFSEPGGWVNDAQFIDQTGSPYLLANGMGESVEDASMQVTLPADSTYRLWVRTKDWMPAHHPGQFQVLLNGDAVTPAFGRSGQPGWQWEDGGVHELSGSVRIALRDLTGHYGRCDVILLARDVGWKPPDALDAIARLRQEHGGVSPGVSEMPVHDVVVIGGGLAGGTAAVAAARNGASVALLQNRPILGGNASTEILVPPVGWANGRIPSLEPRETGLVEEYRTPGRQRVSEGKLYSQRLMRLVKLEPNLDLHLNTHATGVEMAAGTVRRIESVLAVDTRTGARMRFRGKIFIDATGDGVVGVAAGAEYRQGKEPKSMYGEPWALEKPSTNTMGNGLKYFGRDTGERKPFAAPPRVFRFPSCEDFQPMRHPDLTRDEEIGKQWMLELGGLRDTYSDAEEIRDDLFRLIYGIWDHLKNHCPWNKEDAATYELAWVGHVMGKRESRRLIGDYVLTQNDIGQQTLFPDRVAFGAWSVDDHHSEGLFYSGPPGDWGENPEHHYKGRPYSIPFRCLYSKNVENLMMAGRDISASHLGLSNLRVMLTAATVGHAAGTGASMCVKHQTTPRGIYRDRIAQLQQQLLKEGAHIIGLAADDIRDLAPKASAHASSEGGYKGWPMPAANITNGYDRVVGDNPNAWYPDEQAPGPHWIELSWQEPVTFNVVHVTFQTPELAPGEFAVEAWTDRGYRRIFELTDNRHRRHVLGLDRLTTAKLRISMAEAKAICEVRVYDEPQSAVDIARRAHRKMRLPDEGPFLPWNISQGKSAR